MINLNFFLFFLVSFVLKISTLLAYQLPNNNNLDIAKALDKDKEVIISNPEYINHRSNW